MNRSHKVKLKKKITNVARSPCARESLEVPIAANTIPKYVHPNPHIMSSQETVILLCAQGSRIKNYRESGSHCCDCNSYSCPIGQLCCDEGVQSGTLVLERHARMGSIDKLHRRYNSLQIGCTTTTSNLHADRAEGNSSDDNVTVPGNALFGLIIC